MQLPDHAAGLQLQCGEQRRGPVPFVVVGAAFQLSRTHWQHRLRTVQRLNLTLFINAKNHSVLRWIHVQTHDVAYFLNELWIR